MLKALTLEIKSYWSAYKNIYELQKSKAFYD